MTLPHTVMSYQEALDAGHQEQFVKSWARGCADQVTIDLMVQGNSLATIVQAAIVVYDHYLNHVMTTGDMGLLYPNNADAMKVYEDWKSEQEAAYRDE
ncbi:hypothetical protein SEA_LILYPAD_76 [Gordonia phage LilyPad]|nr:hypothetical protein SEA_LILYPAD_76 [Gordonia phage LilyPad]